MGKILAVLALVGLIATPALAELTPSVFTPTLGNLHANGHTVGVYAPNAPTYSGGTAPSIYTNIIQPANVSDVFTVEFAFHWPFSGSVNMVQFQSSIVWDSDEIQILDVSTYGTGVAWDSNNYEAATFWPSIVNSGTQSAGDVLGTGVPLWQNPAGGTAGSTVIYGSQVIPFMQVQFRAINPVDDGLLDLVIGSAAAVYTLPGQTGSFWTGGAVGETSYGLAIVPEPASLSLLAGGLLAFGAGIWRRRR